MHLFKKFLHLVQNFFMILQIFCGMLFTTKAEAVEKTDAVEDSADEPTADS